MSAARHMAVLMGMSAKTLRLWQRQAEVDAGAKPGVATDVSAEIPWLKKENAEMRKANEVLEVASLWLAKEPGRP